MGKWQPKCKSPWLRLDGKTYRVCGRRKRFKSARKSGYKYTLMDGFWLLLEPVGPEGASVSDNPFEAMIELRAAMKVASLDKVGVWLVKLDDHWTFAVNGSAAEADVEPAGGMKVSVPQFTMAVWSNGWLAGLIDPAGGSFAAGEAGNAAAFCAACGAYAARRADDGRRNEERVKQCQE